MVLARRFAIVAGLLAVASAARAAAPSDYSLLDPERSGRLLRQGSSGSDVSALQHALAAAGSPVSASGSFDAATDAAVRAFQTANGCAVDGVVGPETMRALDRALGVAAAATPRLRRLTDSEVTPAISAAAVKILREHGSDPIGTEIPFDADGKHYVGRIELHYHTPGGPMKPWGYHHGVSVFEVMGPATPAPTPAPAPASPAASLASIPSRAAGALTGSDFMAATANLSRPEREVAIWNELSHGNVPSFLRTPVDVTAVGAGHVVVLHVLPDYLAIGSDDDFVRIPMAAPTAQRAADAWGCSLPTRKLVDLIWRESAVKLAPIPMTPGPQMMSNAYFLEHQQRIEAQLVGRPRDAFVAGDKKDLVITNMLAAHPGRVAIYGWHETNGRPIQPLSTVHEASYADYSHGVRLIESTVQLDGRPARIQDILRDPALASILSDEGPIANPRIP
jgi:hypothetical protein